MVTQQELTQRIVDALAGLQLDWPVISADDFSEARQDGMVVVSLQTREQVNVGLDDYRWVFQIICDARIEENGPQLSELAEPVGQWLSELTSRGFDFSRAFAGLPVVGVFLMDPASYQLGASSRQAVFSLEVITSEN